MWRRLGRARPMPSDAFVAATLAQSHRSPPGEPPVAKWNTYVWVEDADKTAARARAAGGSVVAEPFEVPEAGRMAVIVDPEGAVFCIWQSRGHKGAKVVNEHGSVNFNGLATRDAESGSGVLRGRVRLEDARLPSGETWTLPGYGDHLEEIQPGAARADGPDGRARRVHRRRRRRSPRSPTATRPRRRMECHVRRSTTSRPPPPRRRSSAARSSAVRSTRRGRGWSSSRIRKERRSSPASSCWRTGTSWPSARRRPPGASVT